MQSTSVGDRRISAGETARHAIKELERETLIDDSNLESGLHSIYVEVQLKTPKRDVSKLICSFLFATAVAFCQMDPSQAPSNPLPPGPQFPGSQRPALTGTITAIEGNTLTIKTPQDETATVTVTSQTRFRRERNDAQLPDFKIGETVVISGERGESGTWSARLVAIRSETSKGEGGDGPFGGAPPDPQNLGKAFILGQLTKIENAKLTVQRPDGGTQVIEVDDKTRFLDGHGETIKLADFKTGDRVAGTGALKNDVFVATELRRAQADSPLPPPPPPPPPRLGRRDEQGR